MSNDLRLDDYLGDTQSVLRAARRLRETLDADPATREYAVAGLEQASAQQEQEGMSYRAFLFEEAAGTEGTPPPSRRTAEIAFASVLTDLQVANVLLAAGQTLGETGQRAEPRVLDEAMGRLENTTRAIEQSGGDPLGRAFSGESASTPPGASLDLPSAIENFRTRSRETLDALVSEAQGVVNGAIQALAKLDGQKVLEALGKLGDSLGDLPKIGRLLAQGIQKLQGAVNSLIGLFGKEALARVKSCVEKIWKDVQDGTHVAESLRWAFETEATLVRVQSVLGLGGLKKEALDEAGSRVTDLTESFKSRMATAEGLLAAVTFAGTILAFTLAGPPLALATALAVLVILAGVVLIGRDYTDASHLFQSVRGVGQIAEDLKPA